MGQIIKLEQRLANMIAAGEVVERLGNVVKELVENSIDALATQIIIELEDAGMKSISITDNGTGMDESDAIMAFERHATSKIHSEYELFHLASLGFRGEALASIAAVSKVELITSMGGNEAVKVIFQDGVFISKSVAPPKKGTSITVTKLFHHTPARLKHLKSPQAELAYIVDLVNKIALSHPEIAFKLSHDKKMLLNTQGNNQIFDIMGEIYGIEVIKDMRQFVGHNRDYHIEGYLASPLFNRGTKNAITMIANQRIIRNIRLSQAIIEGLEQKLPKGRYPVILIKVTSDPLLIDANIHPTKQEVKFSEEMVLYDLVRNVIKKISDEFYLVQKVEPTYNPTFISENQTKLHFHQELPIEPRVDTPVSIPQTDNLVSKSETEKPSQKTLYPDFDYIGQYAGTYLLFQNAEGLYLIDQHAAAERIRYERYLLKMSHPETSIKELLIPFNLNFSNSEVLIIEPYIETLKTFGLWLEPSGKTSFFVRQIPGWFPSDVEMDYAETVVRTLITEKPLSIEKIIDELAILLACKHSIKANRYIHEGEIKTLMNDLSQCHNPHTCPHGRPIMVKINHLDIEKWFKRVM